MNKMFLYSCGILIFTSTSFAKNIPNSSTEFLQNCIHAADCEIQLFTEVSKAYRPSKEEDELREYILQIKDFAEKSVWNQTLETFHDNIGNVMIRIPATGDYVGKNANYFALQSHMDMVLAYSDAKPGEDLRPYFRDGVQMETQDGWLQSVGNKTTLGADNGIGVAFELRYLIDPAISHPPLELIFTVQEEIGLVGAFNSDLPILSRKMLCLDGMTPEPGYVIGGSQGGRGEIVSGTSAGPQVMKPDSNTLIKVSVTQLAGGHSGGDIHRGHLNAVKAFGELASFISTTVEEAHLKSMVAGDVGILNKIPNLFETEFVVPTDKVPADFKTQIESFLQSLIDLNPDDSKSAKIEVLNQNDSTETYLVSAPEFTSSLLSAIDTAQNGVIDHDDAYYNGVYTSSNLSFMQLAPDQTGNLQFSTGYLSRSFSDQRIIDVVGSLEENFNGLSSVDNPKIETKMDMPAWIEPDSSTLLHDILTTSGTFNKVFFLNAGLEPSAFKAKIKDLEVVALGPMIQNAHSVREKLELASIQPTIDGILKIIQTK